MFTKFRVFHCPAVCLVASLLLGVFAPALSAAEKAATRTVTDFAGRRVTVPAQVHRVYCSVSACALLVYSLSPERLLVWPGSPFSQKDKGYLPALAGVPAGSGLMGGSLNLEELVKRHPDLVLMMNTTLDKNTLSNIQQIEQQTHIPVYYINMKLDNTPQIYERLGDLFGERARAADLARYCRESLHEVESKVAAIPIQRRPRVYYAAGPAGLQTVPAGEDHISAIETAGGVNVVDLPINRGGAGGAQVTIEQVLIWKPQVILTFFNRVSPNPFYAQTVWQDPLWREVPAVRNHAVYEIPAEPFGWASPPASVNRILGIKWLAQLFYPQLFHYDIREEARTFYAKFYHKQLTNKELDELLIHSLR